MSKLFFTNIEEIVEFVSIPSSTSFNALKPKLAHVQSKWIKPMLGTAFMNELLALLSGTATVSDLQQEAIDKIRFPLANFLLHESTDLINISVVEGGFMRNAVENKVAASANSIVQFKEQLLIDAQSGFDLLMSFLEENADGFTTWKNSDERKAFKGSFVKSSQEFNSGLIGIEVGEFVFRKMYPLMQILEPRLLIKVLGKELYDDMKANLKNSASLGVYAPILPFIQRAISAATFAEASDSLGVKVDSRGVYISSIKNANEPQQNNSLTPGKERNVETIYSQHAEKCFEDLAAHLIENADTYTLFKDSSAFTDRSTSAILPEEGNAAYYAL
jgi:hypothetical protein